MILNKKRIKLISSALIITAVVVAVALLSPTVRADRFDEQIAALRKEIQQNQDAANKKQGEANTLKNKIAQLQGQINIAQAALNLTKLQVSQTTTQIEDAQKELERQKDILRDNLRMIYKTGDITPLEVIASSKNLSDFVAQQQYLTAIKRKVDDNLEKIDRLKRELDAKKDQLTSLQTQQQAQTDNITAQQVQQQQILAQTQGDEAKYQQQIVGGKAAIAALARQKEINIANQTIRSGGTGGYPWEGTDQAWWDCLPINGVYGCGDEMLDGQSYYTRQCTSYVAWKVNQVHGFVPRNYGDAGQWPSSARARGISTSFGSGAKRGDAAVITGGFGHVAFVEKVNPDGSFEVTQYNAEWTGKGSTGYFMSQSGIWFIHFP